MNEREERAVSVDGENTERKEKRAKSRESILTKESFCAVFALFGILSFFILVSNDAVFGEPGAYIHDLLLGTFGYAAYPLAFLLSIACIGGFLGKRLVKRRGLAVSIAVTAALAFLTAHTVQTYYVRGWSAEGYLSACFQSGDSAMATFGGIVGALPVHGLCSLTTEIGTLVILSAVTLLSAYISGKLIVKNTSLAQRKTKPAAQTAAVQPAAETESYTQTQPPQGQPAQGYGYTEPQQAPQADAPADDPTQPMPGYTESGAYAQNMGGYAPYVPYTVRQQPGFKLPNAGQAPQQSTEQPAQAAQEGAVQPSPASSPAQSAAPDARIYSPFGVTTPAQQHDRPLTHEESRKILFGGTPRQNYQDNLIFDGTAKVNSRDFSGNVPPAGAPTVPPVGQPTTYSEQYRRSVQDSTPVRPQRLAGDSGENFGRRPSNPYGLDVPAEPTCGDTWRAPTYEEQASRAAVEESTPTLREQPTESGERFGRVDRYELNDGSVETEQGGRGFSEEAAYQPPQTFGQTGNRGASTQEDEVAATDRSSLFDEEPPVEDEPTSDTYTLRSYGETSEKQPSSMEEGKEQPFTQRFTRFDASEPASPTAERIPPVEPARTSATYMSQYQPKAEERVEEKVEQTPPPKPRIRKPYVRVPLHYFNCSDNLPDSDAVEVEEIKTRILETLEDYNVMGGSIASVTFGPTVTRYNVVLPRGVSPKKVVSLEQEIAMGLCREGVNVYLNVESGAVSIEVPNRIRQTVELGSMFIDDEYTKAKPTSLVFAMGKDIANRKVYGDVCKMTHLLVAGSSGSGKSVFLGCLIISLITKYSPDEMRLILIDPKKTEFVLYNNLPHLMVNEIITDCKKAVQSLSWAIGEMERRYTLIEKMSLSGTYVVNIDEYNAHVGPGEEKLPKIVIIVDELADLMLNAKKDMEDKIQSLTQKARAAGIHLILATQRPSTDVITGVIKSNLPTRIAFTVATDVDSRVILDQTGAQKLLGKGDMVYTASGINTPVRVQSPYISSSDSQKVVNFIKENNEAFFDESATTFINNARSGAGTEGGDGNGLDVEPVYLEALKLVIQTQTASISMVQRKCSVGFNKAAKIIEWMEQMEFISPYEGAKARTVYITQERFIELFGEW